MHRMFILVSSVRVFCDVGGRRYLPGICQYSAKRTVYTANQGGTTGSDVQRLYNIRP